MTDTDRGWERIKGQAADAGRHYVQVGLQSGDVTPEGTSVVEIGAYNEFGTDTIPERPFIRSALDQNRRQIESAQRSLWDSVVRGHMDIRRALEALGQMHQGHIQRRITEIRTPPNAPGTIRQKGSSNPLIDTGHMRASIRYVVVAS